MLTRRIVYVVCPGRSRHGSLERSCGSFRRSGVHKERRSRELAREHQSSAIAPLIVRRRRLKIPPACEKSKGICGGERGDRRGWRVGQHAGSRFREAPQEHALRSRGWRLAEAVGALCCADIAGSYHPTVWYGPHPKNISKEFFDATVENCRRVIDEIKPKRTSSRSR